MTSSLSSQNSSYILESNGSSAIIDQLIHDKTSTEDYVRLANTDLKQLEGSALHLAVYGTTLPAHPLLSSMLEFAPCEEGRRYAACAIHSCTSHEQLAGLAHDWFYHLLQPMYSCRKSEEQWAREHSMVTKDDTMSRQLAVKRLKYFREEVMKRDGQGKCVVLQKLDKLDSEAAHILKRSLAVGDAKTGINASATTFWSILRKYANLPEDVITHLDKYIDSPMNGMMLESNMHKAFDSFNWYLEERGEKNLYGVVFLTITGATTFYSVFSDGLVKFEGPDSIVPNPIFIRAHAAIAKVVDNSDAREYIDKVMDAFVPDVSVVKASKFDAKDFELRSYLKGLIGDADTQSYHYLPSSTDSASSDCEIMSL